MSATPTIGVVVPVFRVAQYVADCVRSIGAQTRRPDRVVLVDDRGGDDSMPRALAAAQEVGLEVEVVTQPRNLGLSAARNAGLARLDTDLVWFCDSDDTVEPEFVELMERALLEQDADLAMCRTARVDTTGRTTSIDEEPFAPLRSMTGHELARRLLLSTARGYACNKLFRRSVLGTTPFPEGQVYEDVAPALRFALRSDRVALVDQPLYRYLVNESSISRKFGPHTHDLFLQDGQVRAVLDDADVWSGPDAEQWRTAHLVFRYDGIVLPTANMAARARTTERRSAAPDEAVVAEAESVLRRSRSLVTRRDVRDLWRSGARRQAVAASVLTLEPRIYERILERR